MRMLVGLACVAVIAFVGYFFWGEWQRAEAFEAARKEITNLERSEVHNQRRDENMSENMVLDKIARTDLNPYRKDLDAKIFEELNEQTVTGELQRLRTFAAKDAAKFLACQQVTSVDYLRRVPPGFLEVRVFCAPGLSVDYRSTGPVSELRAGA